MGTGSTEAFPLALLAASHSEYVTPVIQVRGSKQLSTTPFTQLYQSHAIIAPLAGWQ